MDTKVITNLMTYMNSLNSEHRKDIMISLAKYIDKALTYHNVFFYLMFLWVVDLICMMLQ
jgi:hypothetical protein